LVPPYIHPIIIVSIVQHTAEAQKGQFSFESTHSNPVLASILAFFFSIPVDDDDDDDDDDDVAVVVCATIGFVFETISALLSLCCLGTSSTTMLPSEETVAVVVAFAFAFAVSCCGGGSCCCFFCFTAFQGTTAPEGFQSLLFLFAQLAFRLELLFPFLDVAIDFVPVVHPHDVAPVAGFFAMNVHVFLVVLAFSRRRPKGTIDRIGIDAISTGLGVENRSHKHKR